MRSARVYLPHETKFSTSLFTCQFLISCLVPAFIKVSVVMYSSFVAEPLQVEGEFALWRQQWIKKGGRKYGNNSRCRCGTLLSRYHAEHPSAASDLGYASSHDGRS